MVKKYHKTRTCTLVQRAWRTKYLHEAAPHHATIISIVSKFETMGLVDDIHSGRSVDIEKHQRTKNQLKSLVAANPTVSLRKAACVVGVSHIAFHSTAGKLFIDESHLKPYKYPMCHQFKPTDYDVRLIFAAWLHFPARKYYAILHCQR